MIYPAPVQSPEAPVMEFNNCVSQLLRGKLQPVWDVVLTEVVEEMHLTCCRKRCNIGSCQSSILFCKITESKRTEF